MARLVPNLRPLERLQLSGIPCPRVAWHPTVGVSMLGADTQSAAPAASTAREEIQAGGIPRQGCRGARGHGPEQDLRPWPGRCRAWHRLRCRGCRSAGRPRDWQTGRLVLQPIATICRLAFVQIGIRCCLASLRRYMLKLPGPGMSFVQINPESQLDPKNQGPQPPYAIQQQDYPGLVRL